MLSEEIVKLIGSKFDLIDITEKSYESLKYPKIFPMMRFSIKRYSANDLGNVFVMDTKAMGGMMTLSTVVLTPSSGKDVPFLLIDTMNMKKKSLAYVEFYDKTAKGVQSDLIKLKDKYSYLPDYAEKDGWYISERTDYSLIKGGENVDKEKLEEMVVDAVKRYLDLSENAEINKDNLEKLSQFQNDMCEKGNPSSATLEKLFGKEKAKEFFKEVIMPIEL